MLYLTLALTILAVLLLRKTNSSKKTSFVMSCLVFFSFLISGFYFVVDYLTGSGIDESFLYHWSTGLSGAGYAEFWGAIVSSAIYLLFVGLITFCTYKVVASGQRNGVNRLRAPAGFVVLIVAIAVNPATSDFSELYKLSSTGSQGVGTPNHYVEPSYSKGSPYKNIVYLYLESLERTYLDEEIFPDLLPNIKRLEADSVRFTDVSQVYGSGWTVGGMVASQCGIPLVTPGSGNSMSGVDKFIPGATCLGDILKGSGYDLNYMGGSSLKFAGKGKFYETHGFDRIEGLEELKGRLSDPEYQSSWGVYDDSLFDFVRERFDELSGKDSPFGLFALSLDTHHPHGHIPDRCNGVVYNDGKNPMLNAVHCTDKLVGDLVDDVRGSEYSKDTVIVISSDHLAMRSSSSSKLLDRGERRNLFMVLSSQHQPKEIARPGTILDVAPTVLSLLGFQGDGVGFGRSLLDGGVPTLRESVDYVDEVLKASVGFLGSQWEFPQVRGGIRYKKEKGELSLSGREVALPVLLALDEGLTVRQVRFQFDAPKKLSEQVLDFKRGQRFLWVDRCAAIAPFIDENIEKGSDVYCLSKGVLGGRIEAAVLTEGEVVTFDSIKSAFEKNLADNESHKQALDRIRKRIRFGQGELEEYVPENMLGGEYVIKSAGKFAGKSYVENIRTGDKVNLLRGLTLVGLPIDAPPVKLAHVDSCGGAVSDVVGLESDFKSVIQKNKDAFGAFSVVAHDSAVCDNPDLVPILRGLGVEGWTEIGFREPYIAIFSGNSHKIEYNGDMESAYVVEARDFISTALKKPQQKRSELPFVAHAGGGFNKKTYTNSLDALNSNRARYSLFEIDFSWTSDDELVCLHDWEGSFKRSFGKESEGKVTLEEFESLVQLESEFNKCTLRSLVDWLNKNNNTRVVTDLKERNIDALEKISKEYPDMMNRFVPQVYQPDEYRAAIEIGYDNIIWTLYRYKGGQESILKNLVLMDLYGLTMTKELANQGLARRAYNATGVLSWVHTVNSEEEFQKYKQLGVHSIYTDWLH